MQFVTYKYLFATLMIIWGILNLTNGFNIFDEGQLNVAKGFCGIALGFLIIFARTYQGVTRQFT